MANQNTIKPMTPALRWLLDLLSFFQAESIQVPTNYRDQVLAVKELFNDDPSGLVNTMLDFSIKSALVHYRIEAGNENLTKALNDWLKTINQNLTGKVPTGLNALAKEYFRERWKGSSNLLLRTFWEEKDGLMVPTSLFFLDGEDIKCKSKSTDGIIRLGDEQYYLRVAKGNDAGADTYNTIGKYDIALPSDKNEMIFAQRPYESWSTRKSVPYLIKKGVYRNSKFLQLMSSKGEMIVGKALEYLLIMKKGTEKMYLDGHVSYDEEDLKKANEDLKKIIDEKKTSQGFPSYTTNFDTEITEYIPEYAKAINDVIYSPIEKRILAGLGLVEVVEGVASTRREGILNPKPFISEIEQGIDDFKALLKDIIFEIVNKNVNSHKKWMNADIKVINSPVTTFMDDKMRAQLRGMYDRGVIGKRTYVEVVGNLDFDLQVDRRKEEKAKKLDDIMYPPVIQNVEESTSSSGQPKGENKPADKKGPEAKNFTKSFAALCQKCDASFDFDSGPELGATVVCPSCEQELNLSKPEEITFSEIVFEESNFKTNNDLPEQLKALPAGAKTIWRETFNAVLKDTSSEEKAREAAWRNTKLKYKKSGEKWVLKTSAEVKASIQELSVDDLVDIKKLEFMGKKLKLLDKLLKTEDKPDETI